MAKEQKDEIVIDSAQGHLSTKGLSKAEIAILRTGEAIVVDGVVKTLRHFPELTVKPEEAAAAATADANERVTELEAENEALEGKLKSAGNRVKELEAEATKLKSAEERVKSLEAEIAKLKNANAK